MPASQRHKRPRWVSHSLLALLCVAAGLIGIGLTSLWYRVAGAAQNFDALVVTPAPLPAHAAAPLIVLPTLAPNSSSGGTNRSPVPVTILLLGADRRPGSEATPHTDTIMLLRVDPQQQRVALLSLPRDLWLPIPGHGSNRLNSAYLWGEIDGPPGAGMTLARAALSDRLGLPIDYTAVVDFRGFIGLIDAIGGITVDVEAPLVDDQYPTANLGTTTVRFAAGRQSMDGATALVYARVRHPDNDFARQSRQHAVLLAIGRRLRERGDLANLAAIERMSGALVGYVQTDMPRERMLELAWAMRDFDLSSVEVYGLAEAEVSFGVGNDRFAQTARPGALEDLARRFIEGN